jgi:small subunit ribosomal protein S20
MPNIKSAKKRMRLNEKWNQRNRASRSRIRTATKRVLQASDPQEAQDLHREAVALIDRAATRRLFHPNRAARMKSQMARHVNSLG